MGGTLGGQLRVAVGLLQHDLCCSHVAGFLASCSEAGCWTRLQRSRGSEGGGDLGGLEVCVGRGGGAARLPVMHMKHIPHVRACWSVVHNQPAWAIQAHASPFALAA